MPCCLALLLKVIYLANKQLYKLLLLQKTVHFKTKPTIIFLVFSMLRDGIDVFLIYDESEVI
jgi:hypothetical protein